MTRAHSKAGPRSRTRNTASRDAAANGGDHQIKIGEAARLIGVEAYVLRFWETQFPFLRPRHSRSRHRYYDQKSIEILRLIRRLLHSEGYTIAGAKKHIREAGLDRLRAENEPAATAAGPARAPAPETATPAAGLSRTTQGKLAAIRDELRSLHKLLER